MSFKVNIILVWNLIWKADFSENIFKRNKLLCTPKISFGYMQWNPASMATHWTALNWSCIWGQVVVLHLITLAFLKVPCTSFPNVCIAICIICPWQHQTTVGSDLFLK